MESSFDDCFGILVRLERGQKDDLQRRAKETQDSRNIDAIRALEHRILDEIGAQDAHRKHHSHEIQASLSASISGKIESEVSEAEQRILAAIMALRDEAKSAEPPPIAETVAQQAVSEPASERQTPGESEARAEEKPAELTAPE